MFLHPLLPSAHLQMYNRVTVCWLTKNCECDFYTHMGFPLGWLSSHEGMRQAVFWTTFPVTGLIIALKLARAPAVVEGAVAATVLPELHVVIDHLIWIFEKNQDRHRKCHQEGCTFCKL